MKFEGRLASCETVITKLKPPPEVGTVSTGIQTTKTTPRCCQVLPGVGRCWQVLPGVERQSQLVLIMTSLDQNFFLMIYIR